MIGLLYHQRMDLVVQEKVKQENQNPSS